MNNFLQVEDLFSFNREYDFYQVHVLQRRKENPEISKGSIVIKIFNFDSIKEYRKLQPIIIKYCEAFNARAYVRVNKRNYKIISDDVNYLLASYMKSKHYKPIEHVFDKVVGRTPCDDDKKWVIDIDIEDGMDTQAHNILKEYYDYCTVLQREAKREPLNMVIPTPNGYHLITRPFNEKKFKETYPDIDLHKDRLTLLYIP